MHKPKQSGRTGHTPIGVSGVRLRNGAVEPGQGAIMALRATISGLARGLQFSRPPIKNLGSNADLITTKPRSDAPNLKDRTE